MQIQAKNSNNRAIFTRISSAILLICVGILAVNLWFMHTENAQKWYKVESEQLGRGLTKQAAKLIAQALEDKDQALIEHYIKVINAGKFVEGAVLFDSAGKRLSQQYSTISVVDLINNAEIAPLVFVEDILDDTQQTIGYIKLVLDRKEIVRHHKAFNQGQVSQTLIIILLTMIISSLLTRLFYKFRYRHEVGEENSLL
ncbi:AhpA/YtjB family protein [Agaribacter flavus]|uniref:AhpA/YtjB family protein n=1 Tax=Agaribacter flavus TaxID=1902781 RepID=A0ABV7FUE9_9ALTE